MTQFCQILPRNSCARPYRTPRSETITDDKPAHRTISKAMVAPATMTSARPVDRHGTLLRSWSVIDAKRCCCTAIASVVQKLPCTLSGSYCCSSIANALMVVMVPATPKPTRFKSDGRGTSCNAERTSCVKQAMFSSDGGS